MIRVHAQGSLVRATNHLIENKYRLILYNNWTTTKNRLKCHLTQ